MLIVFFIDGNKQHSVYDIELQRRLPETLSNGIGAKTMASYRTNPPF